MACYYCVVRVGKRSNSRSQMFYKIDALKNLAIFTGKHLCWRFFLINFIKKRLQHRCFPVNIAKCLSTTFYMVEYICEYKFFEYYTMLSFNRDINRGCLVYMFSLRFSGSKFLINLRRQFRVRKTFWCS